MGEIEKKTREETREWKQAVTILCKYAPKKAHLDDILDKNPPLRIRWLLMEVFRQWWVIESLLADRLKRTPRPVASSILRLALAECLNREEASYPRIIHHAVETGRALGFGKTEAGFLNGVLRAIVRSGELDKDHLRQSHPEWLVGKWEAIYGVESTRALLAWNQEVPRLTVVSPECPPYGEATQWDGFYSIARGRFSEALPELEEGKVYVQDPFTRIPVELLAVQADELVMDLCAAPGGKSRRLASAMTGEGRLVLVDRPGKRTERLRQNAQHFECKGLEIIACNLEELDVAASAHALNREAADAVLIDVPCSNTGVIQKRPDVKVRLSESSFAQMALIQGELLKEAAKWVRPGGRLVYSTCSIEPEENSGVIDEFLREVPGWELKESVMSLPWECGHDGGGAFLLTKSTPA